MRLIDQSADVMMLLIRMIQSLSRYGVDGKNSETQRQAGQRFNQYILRCKIEARPASYAHAGASWMPA